MDETSPQPPVDPNDPWGAPPVGPGTSGNAAPGGGPGEPPTEPSGGYSYPPSSGSGEYSYPPSSSDYTYPSAGSGYSSGDYGYGYGGSAASPPGSGFPPADVGSYGQTPAGEYPPPPVQPAGGNVWPTAPVPVARSRRSRGPLYLAGIVLLASLVGGGIGGAIGYNAADDDNTAASSTLNIPVTSSKSTAPAGSVQQVAEKVVPSVVSIDVRNLSNNGSNSPLDNLFPGLGGGNGSQRNNNNAVEGSGSGIVLSKDGLILTNNHVAGDGDLSVTFNDGRSVRAHLIEADKATDLAVVQAEGVDDAIPINFGRSADLAVGQPVVAIGSPLGLSGTVTQGIISALHRPLLPQDDGSSSGNDTQSVIDGIQTDAPINPGNSGGALVDLNGNLVGITSAIASLGSSLGGQSGSIGLGFAIPIDQARIIADKLAKKEPVYHALLGVQVSTSDDPTQRGALIQKVTANGPAAAAGLKKGDLVIKLDDRLIDTSDALVAGVRSRQPGDKATITYIRGNETKTVDVSLGSDEGGSA
ncbi:MAG TPA: trypsin-like peptidase domain-containing protein [Sporichthyaceae bacterium]